MRKARGALRGRADLMRTVGWMGALLFVASLTPLCGSAEAAGPEFPIQTGHFGIKPESFKVTLGSNQAGAHSDLTTSFALNQEPEDEPIGSVRDVNVDLPPGLIGNAAAMPKCAISRVVTEACPRSAAVGVATVTVDILPGFAFGINLTSLVYNVKPYANEPAAFAFNTFVFPIRLDAGVRSGSDDGVHVSAEQLSEGAPVIGTSITLWGLPFEHNGPGPEETTQEDPSTGAFITYGGVGSGPRVPFLRNPTACGETAGANLAVDAWQQPGEDNPFGLPEVSDPNWKQAATGLPEMNGCERLANEPTISVAPESPQAGEPSSYAIDLHVPQNEDPQGLAAPDLKNIVLKLPEGTVLSPSAADGLQACSEADLGLHLPSPAHCPQASKVGTVTIDTPLLEAPLEGSLYLAEQEKNPFGSLFAVYLVAEGSGVVVKLAGELQTDPTTGRVTTVFRNSPQQPISDVKIRTSGGPRAPLANPTSCGLVTTNGEITPYSSDLAASVSSSFAAEGCHGAAFNPTMNAGTLVNQAGAFSPLTFTIARSDRDEAFGGVGVQMAPGLLGMLAKVPLCPAALAAQGACETASRIGTVTVAAGPGTSPVWVHGNAYLTGPYDGAPFGLSLIVPVQAGPFNFGTENVRAAISVNPMTAQISVKSDPLPTIKKGVPLQIRTVNVEIDREGFMFNPTNCSPLAIAGELTSTGHSIAKLTSHFQAANCAALPFQPKFSVLSSGRSSHANGASLHVVVKSGAGQANIGKVAVSLPKQLPSRLTTIQKACPEATFAANPSSCPAGANVGTGTAYTPVLPVPLVGPAYLVSHGGAAFPDLVIVLQGDGVTLDLTGSINISKAGITSSAFNAVPDAPISRFDLVLPQGPHSALTGNVPAKAKRSLCGQKLTMPTTITGQNGAQITQSTKIAITGCPKAKKAKKHKKAGKGKK